MAHSAGSHQVIETTVALAAALAQRVIPSRIKLLGAASAIGPPEISTGPYPNDEAMEHD